MSTRYFQHLNPEYDDFQKITTLDYIDNSDPTFVLYYFKDGTKCNVDFIGKLNDNLAYDLHKQMVELSSPSNKWVFRVNNQEAKVEYVTNAAGERVEMPSIEDYTGSKHHGPKVVVLTKPKAVNIEQPKDDEYLIAEEASQPVLNFNDNDEITPSIPDATFEVMPAQDLMSYLDLDTIIGDNAEIYFTYKGKKYTMPKQKLIAAAATPVEEKVVVKEVIKEVKKEVSDDHIEIGVDATQKSLIDNMIDMSQKEECDIDMSITLTLPPTSVYQLIKTVYPKGMDKAFVNIIADRMQIKELKTAVAQGLLGYYDEDALVEIQNDNNPVEDTSVVTDAESVASDASVIKRKAGRPKKA